MLASVVLPRLADIFGRKWIFVSFMCLNLGVVTTLIFSHSIYLTMCMNFLVGTIAVARWTVGYIMLQEFVPVRQKKVLGPIVNASGALPLLIGTLIAYSTRNVLYIQITALAINLIGVVCCLLILPESPKYLYAMGRYQECRQILSKIARFNNHEGNGNTLFRELTYSKFDVEVQAEESQHLEEIHEASTIDLGDRDTKYGATRGLTVKPTEEEKEKEKEPEPTAGMLCTDSTMRGNLIIMVLIWATVAFAYFLIAFELKYLKGNLYMNALVACVAEIIGKLSASPVLVKMGIKPLYFLAFGLASLGALFLTIFPNPEIAAWTSAFILVTRFGASMAMVGAYLGIILLFPTQVVSTAMGICNFFGRLIAMLAPIITEVPPPWPMLSLLMLLLLSLFATLFLRTLKSEPELAQNSSMAESTEKSSQSEGPRTGT